jgi:hypothetical protein
MRLLRRTTPGDALGAEGAPAHRRTLPWRAARMRNVQESGKNVPIITARATLGGAAPNAQLLGTMSRPLRNVIDLERPRLRRFHEHLARLIPCEPEAARADLYRMGTPELLGRYVNWADRFVTPRPRRVVTWEGFLRHGSAQAHWEAVLLLARKIERANDLTSFLSEDIHRLGYVPSERKRKSTKRRGVEWRDKDYALNAFGTHHLHLRPKGSRELLYVTFSRDDAFLMMLGDHDSFDDGTLAQAVTESRAGTIHVLRDILDAASPRTIQQQNRLQRYGFSTVYPVGGQVVMGALLSSAGTSPLHTRHADRVTLTIRELETQLDEQSFGRGLFEGNGRSYPAAPNFEWVMQHCDLCLVETTTRSGFPMVKWER